MMNYHYIYDYINRIDIECEKCTRRALVTSNPENRRETKLICSNCGYTKLWKGESSSYDFGSGSQDSSVISIGQPVDCYFKSKLWFSTIYNGESLFAYNLEHLNFLIDYIGDKLRKRAKVNGQWRNGSLESRLPEWMLKAQNRESIVKELMQLRTK